MQFLLAQECKNFSDKTHANNFECHHMSELLFIFPQCSIQLKFLDTLSEYRWDMVIHKKKIKGFQVIYNVILHTAIISLN